MDAIWDAIMGALEARADYFRIFDRYRLRPDAWLKVEVLHVLAAAGQAAGVRDLRPDRQGCDVSFATPDKEYWLAVKGLLTSYAGAARERSTIAAVEEVAREMDKLRGLSTLSGGAPALLLAAFAFGPEPRERNEWRSQLLRFEAKGFEQARFQTIELAPQRECQLYLFV